MSRTRAHVERFFLEWPKKTTSGAFCSLARSHQAAQVGSPDCPDFFNNSDLSCSPCHHSGSLLRTKSSAYVLELERAMISMKASKLGCLA